MTRASRLIGVVGVLALTAGRATAGPGGEAFSPAGWDEGWTSRLALAHVSDAIPPSLVLAQRAVEREWPVPGDSGVTVTPGARSELGALALSAAVPGAGQFYAGRWSGLYFTAVEVAGWIGWMALRQRGDDLRDDARRLAGAPTDSASAWSFERLEDTGQAAGELRALYAADPDAFDQAIGGDPRYAAGWSAPAAQAQFRDLRHRSDQRLSQSRTTETALWINHLVAALDALRAMRGRNMALGQGLQLKAKGGWQHGRPQVMLALQRRF